jgi:hypothetical protein
MILEDMGIAGLRVKIILGILVLSRNLFSKVTAQVSLG